MLPPWTGAALQAWREQQASSVQLPYLGIALTLIAIAVGLALVKLPPMNFTQDLRPGEANPATTDKLRNHPQLFLGAIGIFLYVGAEVAIGSFLIIYCQLPAIGSLTAKGCRPIYASRFMLGRRHEVGRFIGSYLLRFVPTGFMLGAAAAVACSLVMVSMLTFGHVAMVSIVAVGLFNSIMFPCIFTLGIANLGPLTGRGSSLMIAAIVGGAIIPLVQGKIRRQLGSAFTMLSSCRSLCYVYIAFFGFTRANTKVAIS